MPPKEKVADKNRHKLVQPRQEAPKPLPSNHRISTKNPKREKELPLMVLKSESKTTRGAHLLTSLPSLQNQVKKNPANYADEFKSQWERFVSLVGIFQGGLGAGSLKKEEEELCQVTGFVCQVAHLYPSLTGSLPAILSGFILSSTPNNSQGNAISIGPGGAIGGVSVNLTSDTRMSLVQSLVLLQRREVISLIDLFKTLFPLLSVTTSQTLRTYILKTVLSNIKTANLKTKNQKLNRFVQGVLFTMISRGIDALAEQRGTGVRQGKRGSKQAVGGREALWAIKIARELWRKNIWRDEKTVSLIAHACFHPDTKVQSAGLHFFLVTPDEEGMGESLIDSEDEGETMDSKTVQHRLEINKKRKSSERKARKALKAAGKKHNEPKKVDVNFSGMQLLNDPQTFGDRLYETLTKNDKSYTLDHKVLIMTLLGRVSGYHKLHILPFYSYILKYLAPHQLQITSILVSLAESIHSLTPPEDLYPVLKKIAQEFINTGVAAQVVAAGLNAVTEICRRQPSAMERDLLEDLVEYGKSKDKGVMMASRGLVGLYREVDPGMLKRKDRGKDASMKMAAGNTNTIDSLRFGVAREETRGIEGLDLLAQHLAETENAENDEEDWNAWEVESDSDMDSDSEGSWINVESDGEDIVLSDSDSDESDNETRKKRRRIQEKIEEKKRNKKAVSKDESASDASDAEDKIEMNSDSEDDEDVGEDDGSDEDDEKEENIQQTVQVDDDEDRDEMSLARANKVLEGTDYANLATTKILTPADFLKINQLQTLAVEEASKSGGGSAARRKLAALSSARLANLNDNTNFLSSAAILGPSKKSKATYEERMASIAEGREGREKFKSSRHTKLSEKDHSTTNEEKRKKKNFNMVKQSRNVRMKTMSMSRKEKSKKLRNHIDRLKKGGRRGNK